MDGFGLKTCVLLASFLIVSCAPVKPTATDYKEKLASGAPAPATKTGDQKPATGTPTGTSNAPAGNAQSGLTILSTNCETAGCHKDNGITLTKTTVLSDATAAKPIHKGVLPVFSASNIADMKAALATR